jgi:peptidoglycan hydrolase-like protein with peptidoglycan-binding domain
MTTISPWPLVRQGDQQHPVKTLQYLLRARGHNLTVDGIFGPQTAAAVRAFQQQKGLAVDGIVGPSTWSALIITVRQGSQGDAVRGVQEEFQFRNLSGVTSRRSPSTASSAPSPGRPWSAECFPSDRGSLT